MVPRTAAATALVLTLVAAPFVGAAIDEPDLTLHDRWSYFVRKASGYDNATARVTVDRDATVQVALTTWTNTTQPNPLPGQAPIIVSQTTVVNTTYRTSDLAVVRVVTTTGGGGGALSTSTPFTTNTTYDPPCETIDWRIEVGKSWDVDCTGSTVTTGNPTPVATKLVAKYNVTGRSPVTVPAGTYDAYVIANVTSGKATDLQYFVPAVCANVKTSKVDNAGKETTVLELVSFACADPGVDDWTPPVEEEEEVPPPEENETDDDDTPPPPPEEEEEPPVDEEPEEEDKGFLGMPGPGAALVAVGAVAAAVLARRRR